jgi:ABC-2 type transport system permease protein
LDAVWRLLPVTTLTVRQFTGGRTARIALLLSLIPALFAAIYAIRPWGVEPSEFLLDLFRELIVPTLLPIVVLLPATAAFGDELEDETLPYLLMKPVSRLRLVLGKYAAVLLVTIPALAIGLTVTFLIATRAALTPDVSGILPAMIAAAVAMAALLGAVFLTVSLLIPRALLAGMVYIFAWESLLGRFLPGVEAISSREYTLRIFDGILDGDQPLVTDAALRMAIVAVVALLIAVWRLRRIEID